MSNKLIFETVTRGRKHTIFIERDLRLSFRTKKEMNTFIVKYKSVLKDNIQMLFQLSAQSYNLYTLHYIQMDYKVSKKYKDAHLDFNEEMFRIHNTVNAGDNKTAIQFIKIRNCFNLLDDGLFILKDFAQRYKIYALRYQVDSILKLVNSLHTAYEIDLKQYDVYTGYKERVKNLKLVQNETINSTDKRKIS